MNSKVINNEDTVNLVSVIIPTYGRANLINRAIESVLNQTYENIEIIVVDDNVDENISNETKSKIDKFDSDKIKYIKNSVNLGGALSRNEGIMIAKGEYITFLDDDDFYNKQKIEKQLRFLFEKKCDVVLCDMDIINEQGHILKKKHVARCNNLADFIVRGVAFTPMILMKKSIALNVGMFTHTPRFQDHIFLLKILENKSSISVDNTCLATHYEHSGVRISKYDPEFKGYNIRLEKEKSLFKYLDNSDKNRAELKHATINSKILTDSKNRFYGIAHLLKYTVKIRDLHDLKLFIRNLFRNLFFRKKYF